ncbi:hypothetical protein SAMN04490178_11531 [Propionispora vibrioides]|uniref:Uncharacterized protein n=1 Tax=Propionispora vibrioides TaxID=112903 RepID=A0A1H8WBS7_9FIRM|nr:hypothetical protein SAMN04490178_11531 [Propionispora vibrioides]
MRKALSALCSVCDIEMINMGNNQTHLFVCPKCQKNLGPFTDIYINQEQLDMRYKLEKAVMYLRKMNNK